MSYIFECVGLQFVTLFEKDKEVWPLWTWYGLVSVGLLLGVSFESSMVSEWLSLSLCDTCGSEWMQSS